MRLLHLKNAAVNVIRDMEKNHTMAFAAALAYGDYQTRHLQRKSEVSSPTRDAGQEWLKAA